MVKRQEILEHMVQLLQSEQFVTSRSVTKLLAYCVDAVLAGEDESLKETTIGIYCFGRTPGYDTKQDPIVRVTARRLRSKLDLFYQKNELSHTMRIVFPKGTYVPRFDYNPHSSKAATPAAIPDPAVVVPSVPANAEDVSTPLLLAEESFPEIARNSWMTPAGWGFLTFALLVLALAVVPHTRLEQSEKAHFMQHYRAASPAQNTSVETGMTNTEQLTPGEQSKLFSLAASEADGNHASSRVPPTAPRADDMAVSVEPRL
jgi:hypothetical protein